MRGIILSFSVKDSAGFISGDDGQRYEFRAAEWMSDGFPVANTSVDFIGEAGTARQIFALNASGRHTVKTTSSDEALYKSADNKMVMGVCAGLAHKFDINLTGLRIVVFLVCFFFLFPVLIYFAMGLVLKARPTL